MPSPSRNKIDAFLRRGEKVTATEWEESILPIFNQTVQNIVEVIAAKSAGQFQLSNMRAILDEIQGQVDAFEVKFGAELTRAMQRMADKAMDDLDVMAERAGVSTPITPGLGADIVASIAPVSMAAVSFFSDDLAKVVGQEVSMGLINGLSIDEVARNISSKFDSSAVSFARAQTIARTELQTAYSLAQQSRAQDVAALVPGARKIWVSSHRPGARENHIELEEETAANPIPVDEEFVIPPGENSPAESCMYPRDPRLSPANRINCGCQLLIVQGEEEEAAAEDETA